MDESWVERWRDDLRADLRQLMAGFRQRFGYEPGEPEIAGPATAEELAALRDTVPPDLMTLYRVVAGVTIMDVHIGYSIHRPPGPGEDTGHPRRLSDGRSIVVFASDGGGTLFALPTIGPGPVLGLSGGELIGDTYEASAATPVAEDLPAFLTFLLRTTREQLT